jgi:hypothetical protein
MNGLMLRPDLKTAGGEVSDIIFNDEFVGTLTLVYRESDRLSGSIQLEGESLSASDKQETIEFLQNYVQHLVDALQVSTCEVIVTHSAYEQLIVTNEMDDDEAHFHWERDDSRFEDIDSEYKEDMDMMDQQSDGLDYELVIVSEKRNTVEYHIYGPDRELIAEADVHILGTDVTGNVDWKSYPVDEEMELASELIVSDFNEDEVDSYFLTMTHQGEVIETYDLLHNDLYEDVDEAESPIQSTDPDRDDYTIILARDDDDTLTYEIYQQSHGGLPIGTATVDISQRQITGFIDFRDIGSSDDRELIATLLLEELDKEKEFDSVNISMLHKNHLIDELLFETEQIH